MPIARERADVFEIAVEAYGSAGTLHVDDADTPLDLVIKKKDVDGAKGCDQSHCVIARAITRSQIGVVAASVGHAITKVLSNDGKVTRYSTPRALRAALIRFDETGEWGLEPGVYTLLVPKMTDRLERNMPKKTKDRKKKRWKSFSQRYKLANNNGTNNDSKVGGPSGGGSTHRGPQVHPRQVTTLSGKGKTRTSTTPK